MAKEIVIYDTEAQAKEAKARGNIRHQNGFRPLHTDFINGKVRVTFVKGTDDPHNAPDILQQRLDDKIKQDRKEELENKPVLTIPEMRELLKLSL